MKAFVNNSKVVLLTALLSAAVAGCDRSAPDQTTGAAGTATTPSSTVGSTGSTGSTGAATTPGSATGMSGTAGSTAGTTTGADTSSAAAGTTAGSAPSGSSSAATAPAGTAGGSSAGSSDSSGASSSTSSSVGNVIDDSVITTKVKTALMADSDIKGTDISVETNKGEVMLSGFVDSQAQIDKALKVANAVEGVKRVDNKMTIKQ